MRRIISLIACVASIFYGLSTQAFSSETNVDSHDLNTNLPRQSQNLLSLQQPRDRAQAITVKVLAGQGWGSGILIQKQGQIYTLLTNAHVLRLGDNYRIQTPDGKIYSASKNTTAQFNEDDLALLNFHSTNSYQIATLANIPNLAVGDATFASHQV